MLQGVLFFLITERGDEHFALAGTVYSLSTHQLEWRPSASTIMDHEIQNLEM